MSKPDTLGDPQIAAFLSGMESIESAIHALRTSFPHPAAGQGETPSVPTGAPEIPLPAPFDGSRVKFLDIPEGVYHADAARGAFLSSHYLADFRRSPLLYHKKIAGIIPPRDSSAFTFGRAAHKFILEGKDAFEREYIVSDGPVNPKTGKPYGAGTNAYREWEASQSGPVVTSADFTTIRAMDDAVRANADAARLLSVGRAEGTIRVKWHDLPCQIRVDWFNPTEGIVDLKTCADLDRFVFDARQFGYVHQMAFYRSIISESESGSTVSPVHIVAVEKAEPFRCGVWHVDEASLDKAMLENAEAVDRLRVNLGSFFWPTGYENVRTLSL